MTATIAGLTVTALLALLLLGPHLRAFARSWRHARRFLAEDQAIALTKPPPPGLRPKPAPAAGHHRGDHMVTDSWDCGCFFTWTRQRGWVREVDCLDDKIRRLLTP